MRMEKGPEKATSLEGTLSGANSPANLMMTLPQSCFSCLQPHLPSLYPPPRWQQQVLRCDRCDLKALRWD